MNETVEHEREWLDNFWIVCADCNKGNYKKDWDNNGFFCPNCEPLINQGSDPKDIYNTLYLPYLPMSTEKLSLQEILDIQIAIEFTKSKIPEPDNEHLRNRLESLALKFKEGVNQK